MFVRRMLGGIHFGGAARADGSRVVDKVVQKSSVNALLSEENGNDVSQPLGSLVVRDG